MRLDSDPKFNTAPLFTTKVKCVLVDIEGTTSSVEFVYEVLFPFARKNLRQYLAANWHTEAVQKSVNYLAKDLNYDTAQEWLNTAEEAASPDLNSVGDADKAQDKLRSEKQQELVASEIERLMDSDIKSTGLKELQGLIWAEGYADGTLSSHVFPDVPSVFKVWNQFGLDVRIFSSGSINAQKIFFRHTEYGDLNEYLKGNYDTTTGPKREAESYRLIAENIGLPTKQILFLSDVVQELDAAKESGMKVALVVRPGNAPTENKNNYHSIETFDQISILS